MGRKNDLGLGSARWNRIQIEPVPLGNDLFGGVSESRQCCIEKFSNRGFIAGDGFDVNQLPGQGDDIHDQRYNTGMAEGSVIVSKSGMSKRTVPLMLCCLNKEMP